MNRSFPPESSRECDNCGRDIICVHTPEGGLEANDSRDYVDADPRIPETEWVFACAGCKVAMGIGEPDEDRDR